MSGRVYRNISFSSSIGGYMKRKKIEKPKVFISYAWSTKVYDEKVIAFASRLMGDGIDVLLDKWNIDPGADTVSFMEKCVKDKSVNFVLMLLDKKYVDKADGRKGGVGIETQIISNEVYNNVEQNKFIPIIFERDSAGNVYVPIYLKNRFYYDLTKENAEEEYVNLVKHIYGEEIYKKPVLGVKPTWVEEEKKVSPLKFKIINSSNQKGLLEDLLVEIKDFQIENSNGSSEDVIESYNKMQSLRNCLIDIFIKYNSNRYFLDDIFDFYEKIKEWNNSNNGLSQEIWDSFIHETFIYLIAVLFKNRKYKAIYTIITKSYFEGRERVSCYKYFYSYDYSILAKAKDEIDGKKYYSSVAQLWIENIYEPKISKNDFIFGDLLVYNLSIILLDEEWFWFPVTYIYSGGIYYKSCLVNFSVKMESQYELRKYSQLFGTNSVEEIKKLFEKMNEFTKNEQRRYRYSNYFNSAEVFLDFVKIEEIGKYK